MLAETGVAWSTDADGSVVVGFDDTQAFRWDSDAGLTLLEGPEGETESYALAVTADGAWMAGLIATPDTRAPCAGAPTARPNFCRSPKTRRTSEAVAINDDGSVIVGTLWVEDEARRCAGPRTGSRCCPAIRRAAREP